MCLVRNPRSAGEIYVLEGAPLQVPIGRNLTIVGDGKGAVITRGQTSGRLIEVLSGRLELYNVHLEGGRAQVRYCRPRAAQGALCARETRSSGMR